MCIRDSSNEPHSAPITLGVSGSVFGRQLRAMKATSEQAKEQATRWLTSQRIIREEPHSKYPTGMQLPRVRQEQNKHGILMHGEVGHEVSVTFALERRFVRMESRCAIDDSLTGQSEGVVFEVRADGTPIWSSSVIRSQGEIAHTRSISVEDVDELTLVVSCVGGKTNAATAWLSPLLWSEPEESQEQWLHNHVHYTSDTERHNSAVLIPTKSQETIGPAKFTVDNNNFTCWSPAGKKSDSSWIMFDLGHKESICAFRYYSRGGKNAPNSCSIKALKEGAFNVIASHKGTTDEGWQTIRFEPISSQYWRFDVETTHGLRCRVHQVGFLAACDTIASRVTSFGGSLIHLPEYSGTFSKKGDDMFQAWRHRVFELNQGVLEYAPVAVGGQLVDSKAVYLAGMDVSWMADDGAGEYLLLGRLHEADAHADGRLYELKCGSSVETAILYKYLIQTICKLSETRYDLSEVSDLLIEGPEVWMPDNTKAERESLSASGSELATAPCRVVAESTLNSQMRDRGDAVLEPVNVTHWTSTAKEHYLVFQFDDVVSLDGIKYLAREDEECPSKVELQFSDRVDGVWAVATQWTAGKRYGWRTEEFPQRAAKFWKLMILHTHGSKSCTLLRVDFHGTLYGTQELGASLDRQTQSLASQAPTDVINQDDRSIRKSGVFRGLRDPQALIEEQKEENRRQTISGEDLEVTFGNMPLKEEPEVVRKALAKRILRSPTICDSIADASTVVWMSEHIARTVVMATPCGFWAGQPGLRHMLDPTHGEVLSACKGGGDVLFMAVAGREVMLRMSAIVKELGGSTSEAIYRVCFLPFLPAKLNLESCTGAFGEELIASGRLVFSNFDLLGFVPIEEDVYSLEAPGFMLTDLMEGSTSSSAAGMFANAVSQFLRDTGNNKAGALNTKGDLIHSISSQVPQWRRIGTGQGEHGTVVVGFDRTLDIMSLLMIPDSIGSLMMDAFGPHWQTDPGQLLNNVTDDEVSKATASEVKAQYREELRKISGFDECWVNLKEAVFGSEEAANAIPYTAAYLRLQQLTEVADKTHNTADIQASAAALNTWKELRSPRQLLFQLLLNELNGVMLQRQDPPLMLGQNVIDHRGRLLQCFRSLVCAEGLYERSPDVAFSFLGALIERSFPVYFVFRLILLYDLTSPSGVSKPHMQTLKQWLRLQYGKLAVSTLIGLQEAYGLLAAREHPSNFGTVRQAFNLFPGSGENYVPLTARMVEIAVGTHEGHDRWSEQRVRMLIQKEFRGKMGCQGSVTQNPGTPLIVLLPGGCTPSELSNIRLVAERFGNRKLIVLTSRIITGRTFLGAYEVTDVGGWEPTMNETFI
eukprot:TRINITY_DN15408_c0_g1_i2.p1 TRINITY_DN15408_c0_g1~~TRINITY_DN15408_c0_g1_i2.p1  ORF type:complete len:1329 (+),score=289.86 TRINITY_DN15408_c0_g1_i2:85-4071(+)